MALPSGSDNANSSKKKNKAARAGLPFEPSSARKRGAREKDAGESPAAKNASAKSKKKGDKETSSASGVSAKAQARVDEIRAMNRRRAEKDASSGKGSQKKRSDESSDGSIPEAVSRRMLRRMMVLSGGPVALGVGVFFLAYYLQSNEIVEFAPSVVLLVTMGCFGLGVLGLTYGVLSASWDDEPGSLIGLSEFKLNFGRIMEARNASKT
ncbi:MAG: PAM68 family protein [Cyanobacteria bacterium P01_F01_bin.53]